MSPQTIAQHRAIKASQWGEVVALTGSKALAGERSMIELVDELQVFEVFIL